MPMLTELLQDLILGITEGFTEWLPISSEGHLLLVGSLLGADRNTSLFSLTLALLRIGSALAVLSLYTGRLIPFVFRTGSSKRRAAGRLWFKLFLACLPAFFVTLLLGSHLAPLKNPWLTGVMVILAGILLFIACRRRTPSYLQIDRLSRLTPGTAFFIGCSQILALFPGTSRTTCVIIAALVFGCTAQTATEFALFLGVPMIFGGALREIFLFLRNGEGFGPIPLLGILIGTAAAYFAAVYSIRFLTSYLKKNDFTFFALYRIVLGIVILSYFSISSLMA